MGGAKRISGQNTNHYFRQSTWQNYVILYVDKLDKFTGEQIIALDSLKKEKGILSHTFDVDETKLERDDQGYGCRKLCES